MYKKCLDKLLKIVYYDGARLKRDKSLYFLEIYEIDFATMRVEGFGGFENGW